MARTKGAKNKPKRRVFTRQLNISQPVKSYVKRMIKRESEYKQVQSLCSTTGNPVSIANATWTQIGGLTSIAQGVGDNQRIGNTVTLRSIYMSFILLFDGYKATAGNLGNILDQAVRVVVFQFKKNGSTALLNTALSMGGSPFGLTDNLGNNENIKDIAYVIYDRVYHRFKDSNIAEGLTVDSSMYFNSKSITINKKLKPKAVTLKWNVGSTGDVEPDEQGQIYVYAFASSINDSTATTMPTVLYHGLARQTNYMDA